MYFFELRVSFKIPIFIGKLNTKIGKRTNSESHDVCLLRLLRESITKTYLNDHKLNSTNRHLIEMATRNS